MITIPETSTSQIKKLPSTHNENDLVIEFYLKLSSNKELSLLFFNAKQNKKKARRKIEDEKEIFV